MIVALLTLCTSILILLFIHVSFLCMQSFKCSVRRWQFHWRRSPIFSLMDSKTNSYMFCNLHAQEKNPIVYCTVCTYTALNYNAKFCSVGFLCKKSEQVTMNIKKRKYNCTCRFTCWQSTHVSETWKCEHLLRVKNELKSYPISH